MSDADALVAMTRVVHAPREHVYATWRRPERMARWWSAEHRGGTAVACGDHAHRVGALVVVLHEARPPERIVFSWGNGDRECQTIVIVTFAEVDGGTRVELRQVMPRRHERVMAARLDRLAILLEASA